MRLICASMEDAIEWPLRMPNYDSVRLRAAGLGVMLLSVAREFHAVVETRQRHA